MATMGTVAVVFFLHQPLKVDLVRRPEKRNLQKNLQFTVAAWLLWFNALY